MEPLKPLPPLPPLPPLNAAREDDGESVRPRRNGARLLSWATVIAAVGAIAVGILHGMGAKIFDALLPLIR